MAKSFKVTITLDYETLEENVSAMENGEHIDVRKLKTRTRKLQYKKAMKDPARFSQTHMGDPDHPTIFLQAHNHDTLEFVFSEEFLVIIRPDPEIEEDPSSPKQALTKHENSCDVPVLYDIAKPAIDRPKGEEFRAGPYRINPGAQHQAYYKYSIVTKSGFTIDPDIVIEL